MHDADKPTTERGPFQKSATAILTEEKAKQIIESRQITVYLFRDRDRGRFTLAGVNWKGTNSELFFFGQILIVLALHLSNVGPVQWNSFVLRKILLDLI